MSPFYLKGKAEQDFDFLREAGAISAQETGKHYLAILCLWGMGRDGEQSEEGMVLAKKFGIVE